MYFFDPYQEKELGIFHFKPKYGHFKKSEKFDPDRPGVPSVPSGPLRAGLARCGIFRLANCSWNGCERVPCVFSLHWAYFREIWPQQKPTFSSCGQAFPPKVPSVPSGPLREVEN
jgi:hypothetical protein